MVKKYLSIITMILFLMGCTIQKYKVNIVSLNNPDKLYNMETGYYYFARPDCYECRNFQDKLTKLNFSKKNKLYYVNTLYLKKNYPSFKMFLDKHKIKYVPRILQIKNKKIVKLIASVDDYKSCVLEEN